MIFGRGKILREYPVLHFHILIQPFSKIGISSIRIKGLIPIKTKPDFFCLIIVKSNLICNACLSLFIFFIDDDVYNF